jgi:hypothetical protein
MKHTLLLLTLVLFIIPKAIGQTSAKTGNWYTVAEADRGTVIEVFPNPTTSYISLTEVQGVQKVVVFNLAGRQMKSFDDIAPDKKFYVGDLPRGIYLVRILGDKNKVLTTKKISKQ